MQPIDHTSYLREVGMESATSGGSYMVVLNLFLVAPFRFSVTSLWTLATPTSAMTNLYGISAPGVPEAEYILWLQVTVPTIPVMHDPDGVGEVGELRKYPLDVGGILPRSLGLPNISKAAVRSPGENKIVPVALGVVRNGFNEVGVVQLSHQTQHFVFSFHDILEFLGTHSGFFQFLDNNAIMPLPHRAEISYVRS